jgi:hypothetical protein
MGSGTFRNGFHEVMFVITAVVGQFIMVCHLNLIIKIFFLHISFPFSVMGTFLFVYIN